jgi:CHASE3 domain sensor protein
MMPRFDVTVGQKLAAGFGIVIALVAVLGGIAVVASGRVKASQQRQTLVVAPRGEGAAALEVAVLNAAVAARNYVLTREASERMALDRAVASMARQHEALAAGRSR